MYRGRGGGVTGLGLSSRFYQLLFSASLKCLYVSDGWCERPCNFLIWMLILRALLGQIVSYFTDLSNWCLDQNTNGINRAN